MFFFKKTVHKIKKCQNFRLFMTTNGCKEISKTVVVRIIATAII